MWIVTLCHPDHGLVITSATTDQLMQINTEYQVKDGWHVVKTESVLNTLDWFKQYGHAA